MTETQLDLTSDLIAVKQQLNRAEDMEVRIGLLRLNEILRSWLISSRRPKEESRS